ncbi:MULTISPECIES: MFS transporter [unclassified Actinotalea]|uniref:MFS transporter n=1 Tax=unclassified Actinotalea TaxID=2638618 RepID=UPI0015F708E2|nr:MULTISPECIES: MFS transporter [unclassified Actinotalea]
MTQDLQTSPPRATRAASDRPSLVRAGGLPFLTTALLGRLPSSTIQLGLLMFVAASGLGVGLGGLTVAAVGVGTAIGAPLVGRSVDRWGPFPVVVAATAVQVSALLGVLAATSTHAPTWLLIVSAGLVGAANPQVGSIARSRWSHLARRTGRPDLVHRALGYEVAADEVGFVVGPVAASLLVAFLGPVPALWVLIGFALLGQGAFAVHLRGDRASWVSRATTSAGLLPGAGQRLRLAPLVAPLLACLAVGMAFGSTQTGLTAVNELRGTEALTGVIYGCAGLGSGIASLAVTRFARRFGLGARVVVGGAAVLLGALGLGTLPGALGAAAYATLLGLGAGTLLVSSYSRGEAVAPPRLVASTMTLLATALVLGVSAGAALSGVLAATPAYAFVPAAAAGVLGIVTGLALRNHRDRTQA